jgi:predicted ArsR family transcriptional regulator
MIDEARRVATVLDFHLAEARRQMERLEALEEVAVEQGAAERVGRGRWRRTEFRDPALGDLLTLSGRREGFGKVLAATLRRLRKR